MKKLSLFLIGVGLVVLSVFGCSKKEVDNIGDAQACLDQATPATAGECMAKVDGINSPQAALIRCVGLYIQQGLGSPATLATMVNNFTGTSGGSATSNTTQVLSVLAFTAGANETENWTMAQTARGHCEQSGSSGLLLLATASYMANLAIHVSAQTMGCSGTNDIAQGLNCLKNTTDNTVKEALGTAIVAAYNSSCTSTGDSSSADNTFCTQFQAAVAASGGTADPLTIANEFLSHY